MARVWIIYGCGDVLVGDRARGRDTLTCWARVAEKRRLAGGLTLGSVHGRKSELSQEPWIIGHRAGCRVPEIVAGSTRMKGWKRGHQSW